MSAAGPATTFSVDPAEVARFEALAERWWDPAGPFWPLHGLNRYRARYLEQQLPALLGRPLDGLSVLDVGCGGGLLSEAMARLGARVHGIDVTARNIAIACRHRDAQGPAAPVAQIRYECLSGEALCERGAGYDLVLNMEVVEHVLEPQRFLATCATLVKPGGGMVVATLNRTPKSFLFAIVGAEYVMRLLPRGTHQWQRFVRPNEVRAALAPAGLVERNATGVYVNPFRRTFRSMNSMAVNYMLCFVKCAP